MSDDEIRLMPDKLKIEMMRSGNDAVLKAVSHDLTMSREVFDFFLENTSKRRLEFLREAVASYLGKLTPADMEFLVFGALPGGKGSSHEKHLHEIICGIVLLRDDASSKIVGELSKAKHGDNANRLAFMHANIPEGLLASMADDYAQAEMTVRMARYIVLNPSLRLDLSHSLKLITEVSEHPSNRARRTPAFLAAEKLLDKLHREVREDMIETFSGAWEGSLGDFIDAMKKLEED